jgi:signal transduction histidine kinase
MQGTFSNGGAKGDSAAAALATGAAPVSDFQVLFESAPGLYLVLATDLTIVAVSDAYTRATKTKRAEILGRGIFEVFPDNPDDPNADGVRNLRASLERVRQNRAADAMAVQKYDIRRPESEGGGFEERFWSPVNSPVLGPGRELVYIIHRVEDVTEFVRLKQHGQEQAKLTEELRVRSKHLEAEIFTRAQEIQESNRRLHERTAELQQANEELGRLNERLKAMDAVKTQFFASVSHELRTPLNAILGFTGTLLMRLPGPLNEKQERQLQIVENSGKHLLSLINDLLDLARIEAGKITPEFGPVNGQAAIADVATSLQNAVEKKGLKLIVQAPAEEINLLTDQRALHQILLNLAGNGIKFTKQGGVTLSLREQAEGGREWVEFAVQDTGPGISAEDKAKLFEAFQRLKTGQGQVEGTGLGLHLSRKLAELLGGEITLQSEPGQGSCFTLTLPKEPTPSQAAA